MAAPRGVRAALDLRRDLAGATEDGRRTGHAGYRAGRDHVPGMGPAPGQLGRHDLVVSPHPGRRGQRLDPGRDRRLARRGVPRILVPAGGGGQRGLGTDRVDLRRVVRRDLCAGPELADRRTRRRLDLRSGRRADRAARRRLAQPQARAAAAGRARAVLRRDGRAPGVARPRLLAGPGGRQARNPVRDDPDDGGHPAAPLPLLAALRLRVVRRPSRLRGQPGRGDRAGRDGGDLPDRAGPAGQVRGVVRDSFLPSRLAAGPGPRLPGRSRHGPEQHDPADPAVLGRATWR